MDRDLIHGAILAASQEGLNPDAMLDLERKGLELAMSQLRDVPLMLDKDLGPIWGCSTTKEANLRNAILVHRGRLKVIEVLLTELRDPPTIGVNGDTVEDCESYLAQVKLPDCPF